MPYRIQPADESSDHEIYRSDESYDGYSINRRP